jgi:hypothetical protein
MHHVTQHFQQFLLTLNGVCGDDYGGQGGCDDHDQPEDPGRGQLPVYAFPAKKPPTVQARRIAEFFHFGGKNIASLDGSKCFRVFCATFLLILFWYE